MRRSHGFTLLELMIVVALIAILSAIAIPNLRSARLAANETSAIANLRSIATAQAQFQATGKADMDNDGQGEFGFFSELTGRVAVRGQASPLLPTVLSGAFSVNSGGIGIWYVVSRAGYLYHIELPGPNGLGVGESGSGSSWYFTGVLEDDLCETTWAVYAKPASHGSTGNRTFFLNQKGDVTSTDWSGYSQLISGPFQNAAFMPGSFGLTGSVAVGTTGADGNFWKQIN